MAQKVLIADDQIASRRMFEMVLAREGYDVITVDSGAKVLDTVQEKHPDIALIDAIMPEIDGYQVCETLKNSPNFKHLPVILLAGKYEAFDKERGLKVVGAEAAILDKPAKSNDIIAKVQELLAQAKEKAVAEASLETESLPGTDVVQEPTFVQEEYEFDEDSEEADLMVESEFMEEEEEFETLDDDYEIGDVEEEIVEDVIEEIPEETFSLDEPQAEESAAIETTPVVETPAPQALLSQPSTAVKPKPEAMTQFSDEKLDMITEEIAQRLAGKLVPVLMQEIANYLIQFPAIKSVVDQTSKQLVKELLPELQDSL
ncbi:hypothetical protein CSA56_09705 [candidate division KSB3 bacterium]|uniref:Response regulatory domain-containing protein n=1 Tax=candidate division KSB3 bacterium TaxID=2044937 RepID=A0A2G6KG48_9BACT|nr:MAG: hypothetical protein CSA56_09705 [candidate division KSB3 bacterium]